MATLTLSQSAVNGTTAHPAADVDITAQLITLTPAMARELLTHRPPNRPISKARVRLMIEDLRAGRWRPNGEPLILDADGLLLDGQHRCLAVEESGISMLTLVVLGVARDDMTSIDQGKSRSGADALAASSISQAKAMASTARWVWRFEHEQMRGMAVPMRNAELPQFVADHPGLHNALSWGGAIAPILPASCGSAFFWIFSQKDAALAKEYYAALKAGEGLAAGHPALAVRVVAFRERVTMKHAVAVSRAALLTLAWNCLRACKSCPAGLAWKGERDQAIPFPRIL